ncbi:2-keto-3-deoxy-L-rhamnonate aldolase RhmA [Tistlia consotensis]|uniref:2-keto-3-deoxy-L-rhamnonate aldolase RhmA n=1 Tax=Tistlia consotensis USBA 355 TaxID=560819 RepID=A0A1Y6BE08_9PROT|nr:aldolase/citrate lyase family protein [Tistlia consotensis]SME98684.1 2-keto-3-deoxy-L-rhamnonate aldolase RhmA [Tistlia consotensis USBA 355]SNR58074.1 2-keto-3-deoxy-L-rhamnonate aldolase RhmA [Tistlia consotensis]
METGAAFRRRLLAGERLVGSFVKTPSPAVIEILGDAGLDFLVLDAEHVPLGREAVDLCVLAGRAAGVPILVRVPVAAAEWIMTALDCGAAGIMAPHVQSAEEAATIVAAMRYGPGGRGFSPSTRGAGYGRRGVAEHLARAGEESVLLCQIEDPLGAEAAGAIAGVEGVDCLFVGPVDLAVACGFSDLADPALAALCRRILGAGGAAARTGIFVGAAAAAPPWQAAGASLFVVGTDQAFLRAGAAAALA